LISGQSKAAYLLSQTSLLRDPQNIVYDCRHPCLLEKSRSASSTTQSQLDLKTACSFPDSRRNTNHAPFADSCSRRIAFADRRVENAVRAIVLIFHC